MTMVEILKSIGELPTDTIAVIQAIAMMGIWMHLIAMLAASLIYGFLDMIDYKKWRKENLKFLSDDDITLLNDYLEEDRCYSDIGEIVSNAYRKDKELKRIRKGWWKRLWKKSKDKEQ